ncbi:MAG: hypothetical protein CM15mP2_2530 [Methanobacteriota archaeon]|nr:MAG: hypothetical protein CM15mP2_2530 [Euryarchaeota archaeon]
MKKDFEVHMASKKFVQSLAQKVVSSGMKISIKMVSRSRNNTEWNASKQKTSTGTQTQRPSDDPADKVEHLNSDEKALEDYLWTRDYVDIMREFDVSYSPEEFFELAGRLKPRLYSIASSHDAHPGLVELTVGIVRFSYHGRDRGGLCTLFMADEIGNSEQQVGVFMSPTKSFVLPEDKDTDIIMVGPGTGIAPFRAFMEQRVFDGGKGKNWLFFGDQSAKQNFTTKIPLNRGLIVVTSIALPLLGLEIKQKRYTFNTGLKSMVQKYGNGLKMGHTSTSVVIKHTWLRMFIGL